MNKLAYIPKYADTSTPKFVKDFLEHDKSTFSADAYFFAISQGNNFKFLTGETDLHVSNIYCILDNYQHKENYFVKALQNLLKKNEFLQLTLQMEQELLTHEEFFEELEKNESNYLISVEENFKTEDFKFISHIMNKLGKVFSSDEIAELFSVPIEDVNIYIDQHFKNEGQ